MHHHSKYKTHSQGIGHLAIDAVLAITDIVESAHKSLSPMSNVLAKPNSDRLSGLSGMVYRNIRSITGLVGKSIDPPLGLLSKVLGSAPNSASAQALLSALNGVLGDHLVERNNPLAIPMRFRLAGKVLSDAQLRDLVNQSDGRLLIMLHGLCMNDIQWGQDGHDHGTELAKEFGSSVIYLHYNTGQHISDNGQQFADLLESLTQLTDKKLSINIVAHSMGGLVSRSALNAGEIQGHKWPKRVKKLVFLGTPHHGAPLEKAGNWIDLILGAHAYTAPFSRLTKIRSAGITDLRHGNVQQVDWHANDRFDFKGDQRQPLPLPSDVKCYAIATSAQQNISHVLGDGLVSIKSALGEHQNPLMHLNIPQAYKWVGTNINHMQLLSEPEVFKVIKTWLAL